jgi:hypothetical protein
MLEIKGLRMGLKRKEFVFGERGFRRNRGQKHPEKFLEGNFRRIGRKKRSVKNRLPS